MRSPQAGPGELVGSLWTRPVSATVGMANMKASPARSASVGELLAAVSRERPRSARPLEVPDVGRGQGAGLGRRHERVAHLPPCGHNRRQRACSTSAGSVVEVVDRATSCML